MGETFSTGEARTDEQKMLKDFVMAHVPRDSEGHVEGGYAEREFSIPETALDILANSVSFLVTDTPDFDRYQIALASNKTTAGTKRNLMTVLIDEKSETGFQAYFGPGITIAPSAASVKRLVERLTEIDADGEMKPSRV